MRDSKLFAVAALGILLCFSPGAFAISDASNPTSDEIRKRGLEIEKLEAERDALKATNEALGRYSRVVPLWISAVGGAATSLLLALGGWYIKRGQDSRNKQERDHQKEHAREQHLLEVFRRLGSPSPRIRLGAMAVMIGRIDRAHKQPKQGDAVESEDIDTLVSVLITATKHEGDEALQKYAADGLVKALRSIVPAQVLVPPAAESPLKKYDFQGARLRNAWWKRVDARGVDLYNADLERAGLREAFLSGAVLKRAILRKATLVGAKLDRVDLTGADLTGADLTGAILTGAILKDAILTGAILKDTILIGATGLPASDP